MTFIFLARLDSIDRLENVLEATNFLTKNLDTNVTLLECASYNNEILARILDKNISYTFHEDHDPVLYRTKYLNQMIQSVETPFVAVWDTDVIISIDQIINAVELLRNGKADFVYPYEKQFLNTSPVLRRLFLQERRIEILEQNEKKMEQLYLPIPFGGAFLATVKAYKESGLENENFYGWGLEDGERYYRWENLGYKIKRVSGSLFHLSHERGINSIFQNKDQQLYKRKVVLSVRRNKNIKTSQSIDKSIIF